MITVRDLIMTGLRQWIGPTATILADTDTRQLAGRTDEIGSTSWAMHGNGEGRLALPLHGSDRPRSAQQPLRSEAPGCR